MVRRTHDGTLLGAPPAPWLAAQCRVRCSQLPPRRVKEEVAGLHELLNRELPPPQVLPGVS